MKIFQGRLGRKNFFLAHVLIYALPILLSIPAVFLAEKPTASLAVYGLLMLLGFFLSIPITMRRIHDVGQPGWLLFVLPFLVILGPTGGLLILIFLLCMIFIPGNKDANSYGPPEDKNRGFINAILNK